MARHFNWDNLMKDKNVEDFLCSPELWGDNQGPDNPGRVAFRKYLQNRTSKKQMRILEIGFGSGIDYKALEKEGILDRGELEYFGADVTAKFVESAQQNFTKMNSVLTDGYHLPFKDEFFDIIYLRHVLEHQNHYAQLLAEVFRVCRGEVFIIFFIKLSDIDEDDIEFDGTWYHNKYSRKLFHTFAYQLGYNVNEVVTYHTGDKTDAVVICTHKTMSFKTFLAPESAVSPQEGLPAFTTATDVANKSNLGDQRTKLSVLHTVEFYYPHIGGAEVVVQQISEKLAKRGHHVEVATTRISERNFNDLNGVTIKGFDIAGKLADGFEGYDVQRYMDFLAQHSADVVMNYGAQQWATDLAFSALEATHNKRVNIIAPCGYSALEDARTLRWPHFATYFQQVIPLAIPLYDAAIYHSSMYKDYEFAQQHGFQNSVVIPNGVDEEEFCNKQPVDFRAKYNIATHYIGLCVANYYRGKGQDRVVEAVRQMKRKDFTMVFIGKDGNFLQQLEPMASDLNIRFLVDIPREDTIAAYHAADIFLFGSYIEASPLVIIEAKASKTPFISTDCGNVKEWKGGVVCSSEEMAGNANRLLENKSLRIQLAEEGYKEWKERLTWQAVVDEYEELYLRLHYAKHGKDKKSFMPA